MDIELTNEFTKHQHFIDFLKKEHLVHQGFQERKFNDLTIQIEAIEKFYIDSINTLKKEISKLNLDIENQNKEIVTQRNQYKDAQNKLINIDKEFHQLETQNDANINKMKTLELEKSSNLEKIQGLYNENSDLESQLSNLNEKYKEIGKDIKSLKNNNKSLINEVKSISEKLEDSESEKSRLEQEKANLIKLNEDFSNEVKRCNISIEIMRKRIEEDNLAEESKYEISEEKLNKTKEKETKFISQLREFLATDMASKSHKYAIKTIPTLKKMEEDIIKEIKIWEKIEKADKPKSIPKFYNWSREEVSTTTCKHVDYHLIFDYYPNSLKKIITNLKNNKNSDPFPLKKLIHFTKSLIHALSYLQSLKVCHRDMKPDNLLVDETCDNIFVIDFGESKEVRHYAKKLLTLTTVAGTPKYLSPELHKVYSSPEKKLKKINLFKSDVFALGLVLLELGVLELPKRKSDEEKYRDNIENQILKFQKKYEEMAKVEDLKKELNNLLVILRLSLKIESEERPDFIELFFKMMEISEENDEKIRNIILISDKKKND